MHQIINMFLDRHQILIRNNNKIELLTPKQVGEIHTV